MVTKSPNPVDRYVGTRVRMRRMLIGMSQEKLGEALGITFQQIQKYEKGMNRISASRLQQTARVLGVPIDYFYEGAPQFDSEGWPGLRRIRRPPTWPSSPRMTASTFSRRSRRSRTRASAAASSNWSGLSPTMPIPEPRDGGAGLAEIRAFA